MAKCFTLFSAQDQNDESTYKLQGVYLKENLLFYDICSNISLFAKEDDEVYSKTPDEQKQYLHHIMIEKGNMELMKYMHKLHIEEFPVNKIKEGNTVRK